MKRDPDFAWFALCVLGSIAGFFALALLTGCASPRVPAELPKPPDDYPCTDANGKRIDCSADEWMYQNLTRGSGK